MNYEERMHEAAEKSRDAVRSSAPPVLSDRARQRTITRVVMAVGALAAVVGIATFIGPTPNPGFVSDSSTTTTADLDEVDRSQDERSDPSQASDDLTELDRCQLLIDLAEFHLDNALSILDLDEPWRRADSSALLDEATGTVGGCTVTFVSTIGGEEVAARVGLHDNRPSVVGVTTAPLRQCRECLISRSALDDSEFSYWESRQLIGSTTEGGGAIYVSPPTLLGDAEWYREHGLTEVALAIEEIDEQILQLEQDAERIAEEIDRLARADEYQASGPMCGFDRTDIPAALDFMLQMIAQRPAVWVPADFATEPPVELNTGECGEVLEASLDGGDAVAWVGVAEGELRIVIVTTTTPFMCVDCDSGVLLLADGDETGGSVDRDVFDSAYGEGTLLVYPYSLFNDG